jgi:hypothetical protein
MLRGAVQADRFAAIRNLKMSVGSVSSNATSIDLYIQTYQMDFASGESFGLRESHPAQQVGVAGIGVHPVPEWVY